MTTLLSPINFTVKQQLPRALLFFFFFFFFEIIKLLYFDYVYYEGASSSHIIFIKFPPNFLIDSFKLGLVVDIQ